jgi:riboflavin kinase/FMN adenylyltransferase
MILLSDDEPFSQDPSAVAIGVFDGLHLGHQKVIAQLGEIARRHKSRTTVVTFDPHPAAVLAPERAPLLIGSVEQRLEGLERLGVEQVRILGFSEELASESAASFIERVLVKELATTHVRVGEDFRFGHNRKGDVALLTSLGESNHFVVHPAPLYGDAFRWSSTSVRERLQTGDLATANRILGRPFTLRGVVVHGDERGREIGFPTANLEVAARQLLPGLGVYAGAVRIGEGWHAGAISVGTRPQFYDEGFVLVEVHLPGFSGDLYDEVLDVAFLEHLRDEQTFGDLDGLIAQMSRDVNQSIARFEEFSPSESVLLG